MENITGTIIDGEECFTLPEGSFALPILVETRRTDFVRFTFTRDGETTDSFRCRWSAERGRYVVAH